MEKIVTLEGIKCEGCANTVKTKFESLANVDTASVDVETQKASVQTNNDLSAEELSQSLEDTSYKVKGISNE